MHYGLFSIAQTTTLKNKLITQNTHPLFFGGGILVGGGSGFFQLGLNPELYKRANDFIDLGVSTNIFFSSANANTLNAVRSRNFQFGAGAFARIWPVENFFLQLQPEYNYTWSNQKNTVTGMTGNINFGSESILTGIGYGKRSENGMSYFSVMIDLLKNPRSPYRDGFNRADPVIRAGFSIAIGSKKP